MKDDSILARHDSPLNLIAKAALAWLIVAAVEVPVAAQPAAAQRSQRNQPLLQMKSDFPLSRVYRLRFGQGPGNQLWLYAAGDDKQVFAWQVQQSNSGIVLKPAEPVRWSTYRDILGVLRAMAVHHDKGGNRLVAFGGMGVKIPQVQLVDPAAPANQVYLLYNDKKTLILARGNTVNDLDFSPDGKRLAVAYGGKSKLVVWDASKGAAKEPQMPSSTSFLLPTKIDLVRGVSFSSNGSRLAVRGEQEGKWRVEEWNLSAAPKLEKSDEIGPLDDANVDIAWTRFAPNDERWISAIGNSLVFAGKSKKTHSFPVVSLAASDDGAKLALLGDGKLAICDGQGTVVQQFQSAPVTATAVALSPDGKFVAAAGFEQTSGVWSYEVKLWRTDGAQPVAVIPETDAAKAGGASIARVGFVDGARNDTIAFAWGDVGKNRPFSKKFQLLGRSAIKTFDPQTEKAIDSSQSVAVVHEGLSWYAKAGASRWGPLPLLNREGPRCAATSGALLALGYGQGILVCDLEKIQAIGPAVAAETTDLARANKAIVPASKAVLRGFYGHAGGVDCLGWAKNNGWLVSGSRDGTIMGWSMTGLGAHGLDFAIHTNGKHLFVQQEPKAGTPAKAAGFRANDFIRSVTNNNVTVSKAEVGDDPAVLLPALRQAIDSAIPGSEITVDVDALGSDGKFSPAKRQLKQGLRRDGFNPLGVKLQINAQGLVVAENPPPGVLAWAAGFSRGQRITRVLVNGNERKGNAAMKEAIERAVPGGELYVECDAGKCDLLTRVSHEALWTLYPQQDGNWWIATPHSRFDASRDCMPRLEVQTNANVSLRMDGPGVSPAPWTWPAVDFAGLLHDPDSVAVVDRVIRLHQPEPELDVISPPQFTLKVDGNRATLSAIPVEGTITELSIWLNNHRLAASKGKSVAAQIESQFLRQRENILTGVAIVDPGNGKPAVARSTLQVLPTSASGQSNRRLHFLGVGVTKFNSKAINAELAKAPGGGNLSPLQFADRDVREIGKALEDSLQSGGGGGAGFEMGSFTTLTADAAQAPTEANIDAAFEKLAKVTRPDDLAVVVFAGHGLGGKESPFKFIAQDTPTVNPKAGLAFERFEALLGQLSCRTVLLLDACHSGTAQSQQLLRNWPGLELGPIVLPASRSNEVSLESERYQHGLFSQAILEALTGCRAPKGKGAAPPPLPVWDTNADGFLSVSELCDYVAVRTPRLCDEAAGKKHQPELRRSITFRDADQVRLMPAHPQPKDLAD